MGDLSSKVEEEAGLCYKVADSVGLGFTVPAEKKIETCDVAPIALTGGVFFASDVAPIALTGGVFFASEKGLEHVDSGGKMILGEMA
jgi:hypothetical protein